MAKVHVVGAGLSGLVAAISARRAGHEVLVLEREKGIGGSAELHPSVHTTPIYPRRLSARLGIPLDGVFTPIRELRAVVRGRLFLVKDTTLFGVERGKRKTSIDSHLHAIAKREGVEFSFGTEVGKLADLPPRSILATGFRPQMAEKLGIRYVHSMGFAVRKKAPAAESGRAAIYFVRQMTPDYYYATTVNGLFYGLIFTRGKPIDRKHLGPLAEMVRRVEGIDLDDWHEVHADIGVTPTLFAGNYILAGTTGGVIDPVLGFGIHGALVSGRIAARALDDPEGAASEFRRVTRYLAPGLVVWRLYEKLPLRDWLYSRLADWKDLVTLSSWLPERAIPGLAPGWLAPTVRNAVPVRGDHF